MADVPVLQYPDRIDGRDGLSLRPWTAEDVPMVRDLIQDNIEHLRPYMVWIVSEPVADEDRMVILERWAQGFAAGTGDAVYGVFLNGQPIGSSGFHRRVGPKGIEIGYWIGSEFTGQGRATEVTRLLTNQAFTYPEIDFVEVHHDQSNVASRRVPEKLGFTMVGEQESKPQAPAETGIDWVWRITRDEWLRR